MLAALGRGIVRHPRTVLAVWAVVAVAAFASALGLVGEGLFARLSSGAPEVPGDARTGQEILRANAPSGPSLTLLVDGADPRAPAVARLLPPAAAELRGVDGVARVTAPALVAADGRGFLVTAELAPDLPSAEEDAALAAVQGSLVGLGDEVTRAAPGSTADVGGVPLLVSDITDQVEVDLRTGESIALPVSLLVLVVVFGGVLAASVPMLGAVASIAGALACLLAFSHVIDLDASVVNVVTVLGLGLCIDYGLLLVSRFREELRAREDVPEAVVATMRTAGRTVLFSGLTVAISLSGLLVFQSTILRAVGAAGVSVVLVALLVALTLVPALLVLAGHRLVRPGLPTRVPGLRRLVSRLGDVAPAEGFFSRLARRTQRHPVLVVVGVSALLLLAAAPVLRMELRASGVQLLPAGADARRFYDTLAERFPAAALPQVQVVGEGRPADLAGLARQAAEVDGVALVSPPRPVGERYATFTVLTADGDPGGTAARTVVEVLRAADPPAAVWVSGAAAGLVDFTEAMRARAPYAIGLVVLATFVLLFLMTGSLLVPLKALLLNVVSLGASFGVLVRVFQDGSFEDVLGFTSAGGIESSIPALVLAFGFGLAMDYEVFLLSRIKELRDAGMSNDEAVVAGLQRSGRIITSAALIVVLVFAGFVAGQLLVIKQTGVALAVAVAIDATLVRCLLVPATMTLLGEWNWWAPAPLRRLHDRLGLRESGSGPPRRVVPRHAAPRATRHST